MVILIITTTSLGAQAQSNRGGHHRGQHHTNHRPNNYGSYLLPMLINNIAYNIVSQNSEEIVYTPCPYDNYVWVEGYWRMGLLKLRWVWVDGYWKKRNIVLGPCVCGRSHR